MVLIEHGLTSPPTQHYMGYMGDGFYRSEYPTNSIKVLKEHTEYNRQLTEKYNKHTYNHKTQQIH